MTTLIIIKLIATLIAWFFLGVLFYKDLMDIDHIAVFAIIAIIPLGELVVIFIGLSFVMRFVLRKLDKKIKRRK